MAIDIDQSLFVKKESSSRKEGLRVLGRSVRLGALPELFAMGLGAFERLRERASGTRVGGRGLERVYP